MTAISPILWETAQIIEPESKYPMKMPAGPPFWRDVPDPRGYISTRVAEIDVVLLTEPETHSN